MLSIFDFIRRKKGVVLNIKVLKFVLFAQILFFLIGFFVKDRSLFMFTKSVREDYLYHIVFCIGFIVSLFVIFKDKYQKFLLVTVFIFLLLQVVTIFVSLDSGIDTHLFLTLASKKLLSGQNPYLFEYPDIYNGKYSAIYGSKYYFNYWPSNVYISSLGYLVFNEIRYIFVFFQMVFVALYYFYNKDSKQMFLPLLWVSNMIVISINERAWIDGFIPMLFLLSYYLIKRNKLTFASLIIGFIASIKLYYVFLVPFFIVYFIKKRHWKAIFLIGVGFLVPFIPFLLLSPYELYFCTIKFINNTHIRLDSISMVSMLKRVYDIDIKNFATALTLILLLLCYIIVWVRDLKILDIVKLANICLFIVFLLGKQAFCNYFYFNMFLFLFTYFIESQENLITNE
jgi:hypothetical protein